MNRLKIVIAPDSFKGSLTAMQVAQAMAAGICDVDPTIETVLLPTADGGEGTMTSLVKATDGIVVTVFVQDPLGRKIEAQYGVLGDGETAVIEIAEASGVTRLQKRERNPFVASTFGTGELIAHALDGGLRKFIIGLGGSATNDGGAGLLQALGIQLLDKNSQELPRGGGALSRLQEIDSRHFDKRIAESHFVVACDVDNPFIGPEGASAIFGPQKGATTEMVVQLDENLQHFARQIEVLTGIALYDKKGAGAAGGAGGALQAFFSGDMQRGIDIVLQAMSFDQQIKDADLILTGEGKTDRQTLSGKTPFGVAQEAYRQRKPVILISGVIAEGSRSLIAPLFHEVHAVVGGAVSSKASMDNAGDFLRRKTREVIENYMRK
ncbi:glycerate kinase [Sporosarcina sp. FSL K6-1522]|uniref:glycerate kinase n=1 Tax=Sporosarcina sp. FSL K6-1522 TaxID=2921554 RepID=UPI00315A08CC